MSNSILSQFVNAVTAGQIKCIDLTNTLSPDFPVIVLPVEFGQCAHFRVEKVSEYDGDGPAWYWNHISMNEHTGTHFDAPVHWVTGKDLPGNTVDAIPAQEFVAPAVVIDITAESAADDDFILTKDYLVQWEQEHGEIPLGCWIALRTDWSKKVGTLEYLNLKDDGAHSPGPDASAVNFLVHERDCVGLAVETVGTDCGQATHMSPPYPAHSILHGNGRYGLQCLTNLDKLPTFGSVIVASPLKIEGGSGSPLRVFAMVEESD